MNCENCQELLSEFIDGELDEKQSAKVQAHLTLCAECSEIHHDFAGILGIYDKPPTEEPKLPNSQALWCRINNVIETEIKPELVKEVEAKKIKKGWFARHVSLSFTQMATAVLGIAMVSSLLTFIGIKNMTMPNDVAANNTSFQPTLFEKALSKLGLAETPQQTRERRIREQQVAIDYWNNRVAVRRDAWDKNLRQAFDRNLQ
jgi:predicted anti-sigma-YlaC factor YlaD